MNHGTQPARSGLSVVSWARVRRPGQARGLHGLLAALLAALLAGAGPAAAAEPGGFVEPGQPVSDLRPKDAETSPSGARAATWPDVWSSGTARLVALTVASLGVLAALCLLRRRRRFRAGAGDVGARLEILDRIPLSTRQWVCILRVDDKRVVVGVSGDSMTSLAVLDGEPLGRASRPRAGGVSTPGAQLEVEPRRLTDTGHAGQSSGVGRATTPGEVIGKERSGFWFRPEGSSTERAPVEGGDDWENHLAPYRREVNRLRAMLQNWRQTTERGDRAELDGGGGKGE